VGETQTQRSLRGLEASIGIGPTLRSTTGSANPSSDTDDVWPGTNGKHWMTLFNLEKRVAFITGGNGGIGLGMAKGFASSDAAVVIAGEIEQRPNRRCRSCAQWAPQDVQDMFEFRWSSCERKWRRLRNKPIVLATLISKLRQGKRISLPLEGDT